MNSDIHNRVRARRNNYFMQARPLRIIAKAVNDGVRRGEFDSPSLI